MARLPLLQTCLDEVFGEDNFLGEITWNYGSPSGGRVSGAKLVKAHDTIFQYAKQRGTHKYKLIYLPYSDKYISDWFKWADEDGRRYRRRMRGKKSDGDASWEKQYLDESKGMPASSVWNDIQQVYADPRAYKENSTSEIVDYPTQKPEKLVTRVVEMSTEPGDLVLDCFCGSGTTAAVAEKLGRRWITCDLGRFAIHTARKRFLAIDNVKPFVVQNLGKYERQQWQRAEFGEEPTPRQVATLPKREGEEMRSPADANSAPFRFGEGGEERTGRGSGSYAERERAYREFILSLYSAKPIHGYVWLHGVKQGHMVHVGGVDAPISVQDVAQAVAEFKRSRGTGENAPTQNRIDILGWDFAFELNEVSKQQAAAAGVEVKFVRIPREVLEKKAVEQGDIKFFELAALSVGVQASGKGVVLTLQDFVIPLDDVPQEIQAAITHWEQWIDYWAVDWDNKGDTFHNQWQSYRTRKDKTIQRTIASPPSTYPAPGEYSVVVKVIDILGNDTTKTVKGAGEINGTHKSRPWTAQSSGCQNKDRPVCSGDPRSRQCLARQRLQGRDRNDPNPVELLVQDRPPPAEWTRFSISLRPARGHGNADLLV